MAKLNSALLTKAAAEAEERKKPKPVLPEGNYDCIIQSAEVTPFKTSLKRGVKIQLAVTGGDFDGTKLYKQFAMFDEDLEQTPYGVQILFGILEAAGYSQKEMMNFNISHKANDPESDLGSLKGAPVSCSVGVETYQGRKKNVVNYINAPTLTKDPLATK